MRKAWWWGAMTVLVVVPVTILAVAIVRFDPNDYKAALAATVQDATGRTLALNGPMQVRWSLWPTLKVTDVTLANLPQGSRPDMARAESIEAEISLVSLLWRRIEVVKLTLAGPNILFEQVDGASNWIFNPPNRADGDPLASPPASPAPAPARPPFQLRIRTVHIRNGMVTWRLPARTKVIGIRSLDARHPRDDGPLNLSALLVYSDNQPFNFTASAQPTKGIAGPWTTQLSFAAFDTTASAQGTMDLAGHYDLQIEGQSGNLEKLNALLPEMGLPNIHQASISAHVTNGRVPGDLPVFGTTRLHFADGDLGVRLPGLKLGAVDVALLAAGGAATIDGMAQFGNQLFRLTGTIGVPLYPDARNTVPLDLKAQATTGGGKTSTGSLAVNGKLALNALAFGGLDVAATAGVPDLAAWKGLVKQLPALSDVHFDGQLSIPADAHSIRLRAATLATRGGILSGDGTVSLGPRGALKAKVHAGELALSPILDASGIVTPTFSAARDTTGPVIPSTPLPWASLPAFDIDLQGSIDALTVADQVWRKVDVAFQLGGGRLRVASLKSALPSAPLELSVTADATLPAIPMTISLHSTGIPLGLVARYAGLSGEVSGTVQVDAQLRGNGSSPRDLAASLDGPFSATGVGGQMTNAILIELTSASLDALGITVPPQGQTALKCLGVVGSFRNGVGRFRTIALETTYLSLEGAGQVDLGEEAIALKLRPFAQVFGSPVAVPVIVEGSFRGLSAHLDATGLDRVGLLIDGLFGGDKSDVCSNAGLVRSRTEP